MHMLIYIKIFPVTHEANYISFKYTRIVYETV